MKQNNEPIKENDDILENGFSDEIAETDIIDDTTVKKDKLSIVKKARIFTAAIIFLLVAVLLFIYGSRLNYDNLRRFFVKVSYNFNTEIAPDGSFKFAESEKMRFIEYKNGVAVLSNGELSVFDDRGYLLSVNTAVFKIPMLTASEKYLVSYDLGGSSLFVSNSFEKVFEYNSDFAITYASMGKGNHLAVCSYAEDHKNKITVFDTTFSPIFTIYRYDRYVTAAETSPDNKRIAVAAVYPENAEMSGEIILYRYGEADAYAVCELGNEYPHTVFHKEDGTLTAITDKSIYFINKNGEIISKFSFEGKNLAFVAKSDGINTAIAVTTAGTTEIEITVFDSKGTAISNSKTKSLYSMSCERDALWTVGESYYSKIDLISGKTENYPISNQKEIISIDKSVILLTETSGEIIEKR